MSQVEPAFDTIQFECDQCDKTFPSRSALNGHMLAHRPKMLCPECGKEYSSGAGMGRHRQAIHGVAGARNHGRTAVPVPKKRGRPPGTPNKPKEPKQPDLTVDEIFEPVVNILWPSGTIPTTALMALLRWRHATDVMLEEIKG